ncbi:MAG: exosortase E/protease, VPEID-CTERM system [Methylobacter sp.]
MVLEYAMWINMRVAPKSFAFRGVVLVALLALELIVLTVRYEMPPLLADDANLPVKLFHFAKEIWPICLWIFCSCLLIFSPRLATIFSNLQKQSNEYRWWDWLVLHVLAFIVFAIITAFIFEIPINYARLSAPWFAGWLVTAGTALLLWLLAVAPGNFWLRLIRHEYAALLMGSLLGISAWMLIAILGRYETSLLGQREFWNSLALPTLQLAHSLLGWFYTGLIYRPDVFLLGTSSFQVEITYACSGIEGISLITLFLSIYCWLFRSELRFPQAFWFFPIGITLIWLANAVRIAMLVAIGASYSPEVALRGFHAQAGWIIFTLIAIGAIVLSNRLRFFTVIKPEFSTIGSDSPLAAALLVPLLVLMAASMLTSASSGAFDILYPLRVVAVALALWYFRRSYKRLDWKWAWQAPAIGIAVFAIWILLEPNVDSSKTPLSLGLAELTNGTATVWLVFRALGSVIMMPFVEELAFRGYLIRKLIAKDFENVPLGQFSWFSFVFTSVFFGLMHERWLAGTLAGMGYALALYRQRQLGDAVVAHMTTNALIAVFVLAQARWSLWS